MITPDDVVYMIVTDRFANGDPANDGDVDRGDPRKRHGGDLRGIIQNLPYLRELGVTALWLTPVYVNPPDAYHGYHPLDFEHVDPHLCSDELGPRGSREVVHRFVEIAHREGFKVVLDAIVCHTAPGHRWLQERPEWFNPRESTTPEKWWIWQLPDLNHDLIEVNVYFAHNLVEWMTATGVDGVRLDAARHVEKAFWRVFKSFAKGIHPDVTLIGEVWDADVKQVAPYQTHHAFDSMFDYPLYEAIVDVFARDRSFHRIARPDLWGNEEPGVLDLDDAYRNPGHLMTFIDNHDTPRFFHIAGGAGDPDEAMRRTKLALAFVFTTRGIPQLYYGSELALDGGPDPDNRRDMPWDLIAVPTGNSGEKEPAREMLAFVQKLIRMRRASTALRAGLTTTLYATPTLYAFLRGFPNDARLVVLNNSAKAAEVVIPIHGNPRLSTLACCRLPEGLRLVDELDPDRSAEIREGSLALRLPGRQAAVLRPT